MNGATAKSQAEFGDFQTPKQLANQVCHLLRAQRVDPAAIVEPTCGVGGFLAAAVSTFPNAQIALGLEINPVYAAQAEATMASLSSSVTSDVQLADFFSTDWPALLSRLPDPLLVIGNPPWVTNAALGCLGSANLPIKSNLHGYAGLDALTGMSNFDISEWMIGHFLEWLNSRNATLAVLCKTSVARKVLAQSWKKGISIRRAVLYRIDAAEHFGVSVDACLFVCSLSSTGKATDCVVRESLDATDSCKAFGFLDGLLVADIPTYLAWQRLRGSSAYAWRSGVKHDCSRVMEFVQKDGELKNGFGEVVDLEEAYVYPMLKSSDIARCGAATPFRKMLVTQRVIGEETAGIELRAQATWEYLTAYASNLDRRRSSIYRNRPRFSIFGVGSYSFSPWKVAISGFYKTLNFALVRRCGGKPTVLDDTCYFLPCYTAAEAAFLQRILSSEPAQQYLSSLVFWDAKRPITREVLSRLDLRSLASELGVEDEFDTHLNKNPWIRVGVGRCESGKVGKWESGKVGKWEGGKVGRWEGAKVIPPKNRR